MIKTRSFLKWAGNKYRCLDNILNSFPKANRLIEPFTGSATVFINTDFPHYILGEVNQDLVNLFRCLQREGASFILYCEQFFDLFSNKEEQYYHYRQRFNHSKDARERAALFLYLNRHGYNGLCRYNQQGVYNVPFGRYKKPYFPRREMTHFYQKCQNVSILHADFRETFAKANQGDLIYCDPPYAPRDQRSNFSAYTHVKFGEKEQIELAKLAKESARRGITVVISNHDTDFTRYHYRHSQIKTFPVRRSISCHGNQRLQVQELLAIFCSQTYST